VGNINCIHDRTFKAAISDVRVAREFFEQHLPETVLALVDLATLKLSPNTYIDKELQAFSSDVLFEVELKNHNKAYLYLLVEHQSSVDPLMPFRLWNYKMRIWSDFLKQSDRKTLPLIFSLVFYHGREPYSGNRKLSDLIQGPRDIVESSLFDPFQIVDTHDISDEALRERRWSGIMEFMFKHVYAREIWPFVQPLIEMLKKLEKESRADNLVHTLLKYWLIAAETSKGPKAFIEAVQEGISTPIRSEFMTMGEQWIQQGEAHMLANLLKAKFTVLPEEYLEQINRADTNTLNRWGVNFVTAQSLDDIFKQ
jgi:hypothetical protein